MKALLTLVLAILFLSCAPDKNTTDRLPAELDSLFAAHGEFSGVVLIAENGKPMYHRAFGYRNQEKKQLNDTTTQFELASVSKQFTSMIIMMLQEERKLSYDDPLAKYIPELPYPGITIRHLLTHTSGLPDYQAIMDENWDKSKVAGNNEIIQYLIAYHPPKRFEPGSQYEYSNTGYVLLGSIAEMASGKDFIGMCRERIFAPLGMSQTDIRSLEEKAAIENFAKGYVYVENKGRYVAADSFPSSNYIVWLGKRKGPGRISSTSSDLLRWDRALYGTALVKPETLAEAFTPYRLSNDSLTNYGFGWDIDQHPTLGRKLWHTGSNPGYSTRIVRFVDADKTIILLSNNAYPKINMLDHVLDSLLGLRARPNLPH
ncbi:MAG: beta-lactamase family protein [Cyclobacteriaceae bacterium]|nr:beta-lactamase family protein [Cyclobacteriaceae bacterium]